MCFDRGQITLASRRIKMDNSSVPFFSFEIAQSRLLSFKSPLSFSFDSLKAAMKYRIRRRQRSNTLASIATDVQEIPSSVNVAGGDRD
jgi:hypothetical protein